MSSSVEDDEETNTVEEPNEEDVFSILVATDIHLGYAEEDPIKGKDSFESFEEILKLAQSKDVDFLLLGGDLFHKTSPSTYSMFKCIELLKKYCLGEKSIQIEYLSDPSHNFLYTGNESVNYEDPNLNVALPVFSIHGNHDDPTGQEQISALNLLSSTGLVNYFGKYTDYSSIDIEPILLKKGTSKLAIYGLSHINDVKLGRLFLENKVDIRCPADNDWFHLMVLHQNRACRGVKNFIPDTCLPEILDLVIWGHEHDCRIEPEEIPNKVYISQPGSSVATSLSIGESIKKHVGLLKIYKNKFFMEPVPLRTVRPFIYRDLILKDNESLLKELGERETDALTPQIVVEKTVEKEIAQMIEAAKELDLDPKLPLLRLNVFYVSETQTFNTIRFGQRFAGSVANPQDIIKLRSAMKHSSNKKNVITDKQFDDETDIMQVARVEDLVEQYFANNTNHEFVCVPLKALNQSVKKCIDAGHIGASIAVVDAISKDIKESLIKDSVDVENVENYLATIREKYDASNVDEILKKHCTQSGGTQNADSVTIDSDSDTEMSISSDTSRTTIGSRGGVSPGGFTRPTRGPGSRGGRGSRGPRSRGRAKASTN